MKNIILLLLLAGISFEALGQSLMKHPVLAGDPIYKSALLRCEGSIIGAERIDILERYDQTYDVVFSGGGVISNTFNVKNPIIDKSEFFVAFRSQEGNILIKSDTTNGLSTLKLYLVSSEIGFSSGTVAIDTDKYNCHQLIIPQ